MSIRRRLPPRLACIDRGPTNAWRQAKDVDEASRPCAPLQDQYLPGHCRAGQEDQCRHLFLGRARISRRSLKVERLHGQRFLTRRQAMDEVVAWIVWHNRTRPHSTLAYVSPMRFEENWLAKQSRQACVRAQLWDTDSRSKVKSLLCAFFAFGGRLSCPPQLCVAAAVTYRRSRLS